jgi:hypothetical protein
MRLAYEELLGARERKNVFGEYLRLLTWFGSTTFILFSLLSSLQVIIYVRCDDLQLNHVGLLRRFLELKRQKKHVLDLRRAHLL